MNKEYFMMGIKSAVAVCITTFTIIGLIDVLDTYHAKKLAKVDPPTETATAEPTDQDPTHAGMPPGYKKVCKHNEKSFMTKSGYVSIFTEDTWEEVEKSAWRHYNYDMLPHDWVTPTPEYILTMKEDGKPVVYLGIVNTPTPRREIENNTDQTMYLAIVTPYPTPEPTIDPLYQLLSAVATKVHEPTPTPEPTVIWWSDKLDVTKYPAYLDNSLTDPATDATL